MQDFRKIAAWRKAHALVLGVHRVVGRMPRTGHTSLKKQMMAAAESIPFNIVEGCGARSRKDFARFLDVSIKSSMELEYQLRLARDYGLLSAADWAALTSRTVEIRKMLMGFRRRVLEADRDEQGDDGPFRR